ncbi:hypothetical protein JKP88DRAFT_265595 [Tribonema minus]|uniref:Poly [ADP-ribose] polymerase n=1 Tax=Tribonema minus TaxID=303371 RepID=A0A835YIY5_9STRA|nr:hypothetical protein JKP88DRAFT_265595 [Tribonema minus]
MDRAVLTRQRRPRLLPKGLTVCLVSGLDVVDLNNKDDSGQMLPTPPPYEWEQSSLIPRCLAEHADTGLEAVNEGGCVLRLSHLQDLLAQAALPEHKARYNVKRAWIVKNPHMWRLYSLHRDAIAHKGVPLAVQMHQDGGRKPAIATSQAHEVGKLLGLNPAANEHLLFHGTRTLSRAQVIATQGFDERLSKLSSTLGGGIYFSDSPDVTQAFSACVRGGFDGTADGDVFILVVARVLLGQPHFTSGGHANIRRPPCMQGHFSEECGHALCDSVIREQGTRQMCIYDRYSGDAPDVHQRPLQVRRLAKLKVKVKVALCDSVVRKQGTRQMCIYDRYRGRARCASTTATGASLCEVEGEVCAVRLDCARAADAPDVHLRPLQVRRLVKLKVKLNVKFALCDCVVREQGTRQMCTYDRYSVARGRVMPVATKGSGRAWSRLRTWCHVGSVLLAHLGGGAGAPAACRRVEGVFKLVVDDRASYATLVHAAACQGSNITVQWHGPVTVDKPIIVAENTPLEIVGAAGAAIDGHSSTRLLRVNVGATVLFRNMTLMHGRTDASDTQAKGGGAAFVASGGSLTAVSSRFLSNTAEVNTNFDTTAPPGSVLGGAVYQDPGGIFNCTGCVFEGNTAFYGGAICSYGNASLTYCNFTSNSACHHVTVDHRMNVAWCIPTSKGPFGGASDNDGAALFTSCIFTPNSAKSQGGAIIQAPGGVLDCTDCVFAKNAAEDKGGAIYQNKGGVLHSTNCVFENNTGRYGGALSNYGNASFRSCDFTSNRVVMDIGIGGAIYQQHGALFSCADCVFKENKGAAGGAIGNNGGSVSVASCNFIANSVEALGGAIMQGTGGALRCTNSVFTQNEGPYGGAIDIAGKAWFTSCNFTSNSAAIGGGAVHGEHDGMLNCIDSVFAQNTAEEFGGAIVLHPFAKLRCINTEFTRNHAGHRGGALSLDAAATAAIEQCRFNANASPRGGAVAISVPTLDRTAISFSGCQFLGNIAESGAGGAFVQEGTGSALFAEVDSETVFADSSAKCCYAGGQKSGVGHSCLDVCTGFDGGWECCGDNQYIGAGATNGTSACKGCDATGLACSGVGVTIPMLALDQGYWRETLTQEVIRMCWNSAACGGGAAAASVDDYCTAGYKGPYCAVCSDNYAALVGYRCVECTDTAVAVAFVVIALVAVVAVFLAWVLASAVGGTHTASEDSGGAKGTDIRSRVIRTVSVLARRLRVPVIVFQVVTQYVSITGAVLPPAYTRFLHGMSIFLLDLRWLTSPGCAMSVNFYGRLLIATLAPLAVVALIFVPRLCLIARSRSEQASRGSHAMLQSLAEKDLNAVLGFTFLIFSGVSVTIFQTFACDDLQFIDKSYLRADYSVECYTAEHTAYRIFSIIMVVVYPIGIPALYMGTLWRCFGAHRVREQTSQLTSQLTKVSSFLWQPYQRGAYYWEVVECLRRLMVTGLLVFIMPGTPGQSAVACVFAFFTGVVYESKRPHEEGYDTWLYRLGEPINNMRMVHDDRFEAGYSIIYITYFLSLLMHVSYTDEQSETIIGNLLIALNVLLLIMALGQALLVLSSVRTDDGPLEQASMFGIFHRSSQLSESELRESEPPEENTVVVNAPTS